MDFDPSKILEASKAAASAAAATSMLPVWLCTGAGGIMVSAIVALWRVQVNGNRKCEERNTRLENEIKETKDLVISKAEDREGEAHERTERFAKILEKTTSVTEDAVEVLRFFKQQGHSTPTPHAVEVLTEALEPLRKVELAQHRVGARR